MLFRQIIHRSLFVGLIVGTIFSVAQILSVNPLIFEAEKFEISEQHDHASHDHSEEAWEPDDGLERTFYTVSANVIASIGFAVILLALMCQFHAKNTTQISITKGLLWGLGGFITFFVAPAIGLPPEIPGVEAAVVEHRQFWWVLAVAGVGIGLLCLCFAPVKFKLIGLVTIAFPYVIGAPHLKGPLFAHPDPSVVEALTAIHSQFVIASSASNLLLWVALGIVSVLFLRNMDTDVTQDI